MLKTIHALAMAVALLAIALPADAAPVNSALTYELRCDMNGDGYLETDSTVIHAFGSPGWLLVDGGVSRVPLLLMGGTFTRSDDTASITFTTPPPEGLLSRVTLCRIEGPLESVGFDLLVDPAFVLFLAGSE